MTGGKKTGARAIADLTAGTILATVDIAAAPERVFRALTSDEAVQWWGSDETYRTTGWEAEVRVGGRFRATGVGHDGAPFSVQGEYLEIDAPHRLVQTWEPDWDQGAKTTLTYTLAATPTGTRLTLRHEGFGGRAESCSGHAAGWEMVLGWLDAHVAPRKGDARKYFVVKLVPPRASFMADMNADERDVMMKHVGYWTEMLHAGNAVVFGPVADPAGPHGIGILEARDEQELTAMLAKDPAITAGRGFRHEVAPMVQAVVRE